MLAHFVGFGKQKNADIKYISNILLVLIQEAIRLKLNSIDFARTALEIKSSVGAQSEQLYCLYFTIPRYTIILFYICCNVCNRKMSGTVKEAPFKRQNPL